MDGDASSHPLGFLIGRWKGEGTGGYPTIEAFAYGEEVSFAQPPGKPFLSYTQRTWALDDGRPMHAERGYLRCPDGTHVELLVAHPTGHVEVAEGEHDGATIRLATTGVARSASAKEVTALEREITVEGDVLRYRLGMAAVGRALTTHLTAVLQRQVDC